jgi:hypothetical protein
MEENTAAYREAERIQTVARTKQVLTRFGTSGCCARDIRNI